MAHQPSAAATYNGRTMRPECREAPPALLRRGIAELNGGAYFEQHEILEDLWRAERREVRRLYQGILQIGVAMHHLRNRNHHGAVYMLQRGMLYLRPFSPCCQSVDVADLLAQAARILAAVEDLGPAGLERFDWALAPHVRLVPEPSPGKP
ncbi:MAG: DUF309 domain-containing protein [Acidobacteria bacterium]|nr:DUF309 domain-containing protein [Acidobacteriota bacterium]